MAVRLMAFLMFFLTASTVWAEPKTATDKIVDRFMALDEDGSGSVAIEEYIEMVSERALERFIQMDTDGDGEVTDLEYREFWQQKKAKWYRLER